MFSGKIFINKKLHKYLTIGQKKFKKEYMHLPWIYLLGIPIVFGLGTLGFGIPNKPIICEDNKLNNNNESMFWTPL